MTCQDGEAVVQRHQSLRIDYGYPCVSGIIEYSSCIQLEMVKLFVSIGECMARITNIQDESGPQPHLVVIVMKAFTLISYGILALVLQHANVY